MATIIFKKLSFSRIFYTILLNLLHISLSNCSTSKSHIGGFKQASDSEIANRLSVNASSTIADGIADPLKKCNKGLVCFNFNTTIINENAHRMLAHLDYKRYIEGEGLWVMYKGKIMKYNKEGDIVDTAIVNEDIVDKNIAQATIALFNSRKLTFRDPNGLNQLIDWLRNEGHQFAITTFSKYPDSITVLLKELGWTEEQIKSLPIIGGISYSKIEHIKKAKELTGIKNNSDIVLIDSNNSQVNRTRVFGCKTAHVNDKFFWHSVKEVVNQVETRNST